MSNGDFEVMPIGTMEEIREMRKLANELFAAQSLQQMLEITQQMRDFYAYHVEKYPVVV